MRWQVEQRDPHLEVRVQMDERVQELGALPGCERRDELPLELDLAGDRSFDDGRLVGMSSNAIQQLMKRLDAPSPHAWRRGRAVHALKRGISQVSVQTAAGWSSGAMVARYTSGMSAELAISEFILRRNEPHNKLFI